MMMSNTYSIWRISMFPMLKEFASEKKASHPVQTKLYNQEIWHHRRAQNHKLQDLNAGLVRHNDKATLKGNVNKQTGQKHSKWV